MGNATWVYFNCRAAVRRPTEHREAVPCPQCGHDCRCVGTKIRVPFQANERAWQDLRASLNEQGLAAAEQRDRMRVSHRHRLERKIAELEARPAGDDQARTIRRLRERLASI